ncbi:hypothetical protein [Ahrensia sp. R2A130]|uniref:hypothetical protein n=1 Tax=Ahrensia sp. R2A130 TaxID=744979 RepID=UPI0001E0C303|nr:hypothetical protein [Ahrensia sp. R2A130]EFL90212.1 hypothetical protein R2A130_0282 [Ahrensia sp. R2A130]
MLTYLIEREHEEILRTSKRRFECPDGETRTIEVYRAVWNWYDRIVADAAYDEASTLALALQWSHERNVSLDDAFALSVQCILKAHDEAGWDLTNDTAALDMARKRIDAFKARQRAKQEKRPDD